MTVSLEPQQRLIWSADVATPDEVLARIKAEPRIRVIKVDRLFIDRHGLEIVRCLVNVLDDHGVQVFLDSKLIEIPSKLEELARLHATFVHPAMLNCMAGCISNGKMTLAPGDGELDGLKRFADVCNTHGVMPVGVTVLTSKDGAIVEDEFNSRPPIGQVLYYVDRLIAAGFGGVVCSPMEVAAIRSLRADDLELLTPGVRLPGGSTQDQAEERVATPGEAIRLGATRVVAGREITRDIEGQNLDRMLAEIKTAEAKMA